MQGLCVGETKKSEFIGKQKLKIKQFVYRVHDETQ